MNSRKTFIFIAFTVVVFIVAILMAFGFQNSSEHKILFEKAKFTMETKGDLKGAIKLFEEIIKKYPDEREYAAKSQLYIGLCYEKLGLKEAQKAYQKVIDNYPEQQQEVAVAKDKLADIAKSLEKIPHKPTFRKIRIPANPGSGVLSPDGKNLVFVSEGCIWSVPIQGKVDPDIAGTPIQLTEATETMRAWDRCGTLALSADGKWIAFNPEENEKREIYIIPSSGGEPKKVLTDIYRQGYWCDFRLSLSPDGKVVAFSAREQEEQSKGKKNFFSQKSYIYTIPVEGGVAKKLTEAWSSEPAFSPDGKKIAYVKNYLSEPGKTQTDIWVIPASGGTPVQVSDCASGRARGPVWSPDGKMIAFNFEHENDAASKELWIVPAAENGKPLAPPSKIELPLETLHMVAGWTPDNKIGLQLMNPEHNALYTVPAAGGKAVQVSPEGQPENPRWSPDGKRIYFRDGPNISSVPAGGGEVAIVLHADRGVFESAPGGGNDISPDGKKIVFSGAVRVTKGIITNYEVDIYTMPIEGGEPVKITKSPGQDRFPCWSPDGKRVAFIRYSDPPKNETYIMNICLVSAEGGEVRQITSESDKVFWSCIDWSPDGKSIAYFSEDKTIKAIPVEGGKPRVIVHLDKLSNYAEMAWSPDGKKLAYACQGKILVVAPDGGEPVEVKTGMSPEASKIGWSPDGKKIAFAQWTGGDHELWLMEDFLSLIIKKANR